MKIKGIDLELVKRSAFGTLGDSLINVSKLAEVTSITLLAKYLAAWLMIFLVSKGPLYYL